MTAIFPSAILIIEFVFKNNLKELLKMKRVNHYNPDTKTMNYFTEHTGNTNIFSNDINKMNAAILEDFYKAVDWFLGRGYEEYVELISNTINPAQQHAFLPLREYRVKRNGHYKVARIYHRFFGGCWIEEGCI